MSRYLRMSAALAILAMAQSTPVFAQAPASAAGPAPATPARKLTGKSLRRIEKRERRTTTPKARHEQ